MHSLVAGVNIRAIFQIEIFQNSTSYSAKGVW